MNLLLDHQQVHQRLVDDWMGPVPALVEQPAERIFHGPGGGGEDVSLDRGKMDDVFADEALGDVEPVGIDVVQHQEVVRQIPHRVPNVNPFDIFFIKVDVAQAVGFDDVDLLVFPLAQPGIDDHGAVVRSMDGFAGIAVLQQRADDAFELPGRGGAARIEEMPGDVDLEGGFDIFGQMILIIGQVHQPIVIGEDGPGRSAQNCDFAFLTHFVW